jgi:hypothetical protein
MMDPSSFLITVMPSVFGSLTAVTVGACGGGVVLLLLMLNAAVGVVGVIGDMKGVEGTVGEVQGEGEVGAYVFIGEWGMSLYWSSGE